MQDLDNFILPIPGFESNIPIPAIPISAHDPSVGFSASASRTRDYKRKVPIDLSPPKKAKKTTGKPSGGIKITGTKQKAPASTPPLGIRKGIPILRSKRYTYLDYSLLPLLIHKLQYRVPQDICSPSPAKNIALDSKSPKVDKPLSPSIGKTFPETPNPPGLEDISIPTGVASNPTSMSAADSRRDATHQSPRPDPVVHQEASSISPKSFGLGAHGGAQPGEGSSVPRPKKQP
jgi:hypothetical protein